MLCLRVQHGGQKQAEIRPGLQYKPLGDALCSQGDSTLVDTRKETVYGQLRDKIAQILRDEKDVLNGHSKGNESNRKKRKSFNRRKVNTVKDFLHQFVGASPTIISALMEKCNVDGSASLKSLAIPPFPMLKGNIVSVADDNDGGDEEEVLFLCLFRTHFPLSFSVHCCFEQSRRRKRRVMMKKKMKCTEAAAARRTRLLRCDWTGRGWTGPSLKWCAPSMIS